MYLIITIIVVVNKIKKQQYTKTYNHVKSTE